MSHVPLDIRETEETEGTAGNSSGTGGDVIFFFFPIKYIFILILYFQTLGLKFKGEEGLFVFLSLNKLYGFSFSTVSILKWSYEEEEFETKRPK